MKTNKPILLDFIVDKLTNSIQNTISGDSFAAEGLLSLTLEPDHIYMHLLENAPFNIGQDKLYEGVAGNLVDYTLGGHRMIIPTHSAQILIDKYFKS